MTILSREDLRSNCGPNRDAARGGAEWSCGV